MNERKIFFNIATSLLIYIQLEYKIKAVLMDGFYFMERVTRLELATSTLARWRSTR